MTYTREFVVTKTMLDEMFVEYQEKVLNSVSNDSSIDYFDRRMMRSAILTFVGDVVFTVEMANFYDKHPEVQRWRL